MVLVSHMISQHHVIKESYDFIGKNPLRQVIILLSLMVIGILVVET